MPSEWNMFVKKIYQEGKAKNPDYEFKQALIDASKRKGEMGHSKVKPTKTHKGKKSKKMGKRSRKSVMGSKTRRRRRH
jgi:hypothetical protein